MSDKESARGKRQGFSPGEVSRKNPFMTESMPVWRPNYTITPSIARRLMEIEAARAVVEHTPLPPTAEAELRHRARVRSTHFSTRIEGNRLTLDEAEHVISEARLTISASTAVAAVYWRCL